jgi:hypothetical protein
MTTLDVEVEAPFGVKILNAARGAACDENVVRTA